MSSNLKKVLVYSLGAIIGGALGAVIYYGFLAPDTKLGAPLANLTRGLAPISNNTYDIGTSTVKYRNLYVNYASTTAFSLSGVLNCTEALETDANGGIVCGTDATGASLDPDVVIAAYGGTNYLRASTTANSWYFNQGFLSVASSTINSGLNLTGTLNASSSVLVGSFLDFKGVTANPAAPTAGSLRLHASTTNGFTRLELDAEGTGNAILDRDNIMVVKNDSGGALAVGDVVYAKGVAEGVPTVGKARANSLTTLPALGLMMDTPADGAYGRVMVSGIMTMNTSSFSADDDLWVSTATAGAMQNTRPSGTSAIYVQRIAYVLSQNTSGLVFVNTAFFVGNMETGTVNNFAAGGTLTVTGNTTLTGLLIANNTGTSTFAGGLKSNAGFNGSYIDIAGNFKLGTGSATSTLTYSPTNGGEIDIATSTKVALVGVEKHLFGLSVPNPASASSSIPIGAKPYPFTASHIACAVNGGTNVVVRIRDTAGNAGNNITCTTTSTSTEFAITSNGTFTRYEGVNLDIVSTSGAVNALVVNVYGTQTAQ